LSCLQHRKGLAEVEPSYFEGAGGVAGFGAFMDDDFAVSSCTAGAQGRFDLEAKPLVDLDGINPKQRAAFHFKEFRSSVIVPLDFDPVFYSLSDWTGDVNAALRSFAPQTSENGACDTAKRLPGIVRHRKHLLKTLEFWSIAPNRCLTMTLETGRSKGTDRSIVLCKFIRARFCSRNP
jgi:hypothetical protein